ncbi:tetratricopeptide repeat protein 17-like [Eupeodes corollae]|uniref:tetratricopeptide repeat protein 17-like n=1 Tax=Eupeodes corollae TaxID=290404 RepID=UPI0024922EEE|nr:tetratricopeptide repeat protein 17-like [Eupeodes corollae]
MNLNVFMAYLAVCALCLQIPITNSKTSTLWKLNTDDRKITGRIEEDKDIVLLNSAVNEKYKNDDVFNIITSTIAYGSTWSKQSVERSCDIPCDGSGDNDSGGVSLKGIPPTASVVTVVNTKTALKKTNSELDEVLDCGKPVNFTYYDYLIGVAQRFNHPLIPEPDVAYLFLKNKDEKSLKSFDISLLEKRLKRARKDKPRSVHLYNQIGNYWRIRGDARQSIECFRRALAISPTNAEVLLNLARVLYNLQYLDDAIHLTRRSLEVQPPDRSAWRQYFTLGEIFKAYGHFQESVLHLRHALELYPQHEPILKALRDVENNPTSPLHVYTILIIAALVIAVFIVIITSSDNSDACGQQSEFEPKIQRHFNRAMAMRSLKGFSSRNFKHRKY